MASIRSITAPSPIEPADQAIWSMGRMAIPMRMAKPIFRNISQPRIHSSTKPWPLSRGMGPSASAPSSIGNQMICWPSMSTTTGGMSATSIAQGTDTTPLVIWWPSPSAMAAILMPAGTANSTSGPTSSIYRPMPGRATSTSTSRSMSAIPAWAKKPYPNRST